MAEKKRSVSGIFDDLLEALASPRSKREMKTKVTTSVKDQEFDALVEGIEGLISKYTDTKGGDIKVSFKISVSGGGAVVHEAGVIACPQCGKRNRIRGRGVEGASCGACRASLAKALN